MPNPPKPTALKVINGSAAHHPERANPAEPRPAVGVVPPPWLPRTGPARREFDRLAERLARLRVMTEADGESLALGCMALGEFLAARRDRNGWRRAESAWKRYAAMLGKFGANPSDRTRVKVADDTAEDPLDALLRKAAAP